jgi:RNA 2',3'-cyclic 3'-phosphodiesterase
MAVRCFIAVAIPEPVKKSIGEAADTLRESGADVKWVAADNIHITLKFLGSTDEEIIEDIKDALAQAVSSYRPFYVRISGAGHFPPGRHPRVVWIGLGDSGVLPDLHGHVDKAMRKFGFPEEGRPFSPHLTIGRVGSDKRMTELLKRLDEFHEKDFGVMEIKGITLMKSILKPAGAEYFSLAEIPFGGR